VCLMTLNPWIIHTHTHTQTRALSLFSPTFSLFSLSLLSSSISHSFSIYFYRIPPISTLFSLSLSIYLSFFLCFCSFYTENIKLLLIHHITRSKNIAKWPKPISMSITNNFLVWIPDFVQICFHLQSESRMRMDVWTFAAKNNKNI